MVARYADACNMFTSNPAEVARKLDVLRRHCVDAGRDYADVHKTILYVGDALATGDVGRFVGEMADYSAIGIETVIVMPTGDSPETWIENICGSAVPRLAELVTT
jgi:hypothetical protein